MIKNPKIKKNKYYSLLEEESSQIIFSTISYSLMFVKPIPPKKSIQRNNTNIRCQLLTKVDDNILEQSETIL